MHGRLRVRGANLPPSLVSAYPLLARCQRFVRTADVFQCSDLLEWQHGGVHPTGTPRAAAQGNLQVEMEAQGRRVRSCAGSSPSRWNSNLRMFSVDDLVREGKPR